MIYVASDLHLEHENIIDYCDRPFETVDEMNETLVENWNTVVSPEDTVLYLGDLVPFERQDHVVLDWLEKLHGEIIFIRGNHDKAVPIKSYRHSNTNSKESHFI